MRNSVVVEWAEWVAFCGRLDIATGRVRRFRRSRLAPGERTAGSFTRRAKAPIALYRHDGLLWLQQKDRRIALRPDMVAELTPPSRSRTLTIRSDGEPVWSATYRPERIWDRLLKGVHDPTMTDEEDFDFGLLVSNVLGTPGRIDRFRAD